MAPKKPVAPKDRKELTATCGLFAESCSLPGWDDQEVQQESWGGDLQSSPSAVDASTLFVDTEFASTLEKVFGAGRIADWRRPSAYFSPFKPVVFRSPLGPNVPNPYEYAGKDAASGAAPPAHTPRDVNSNAADDEEDSTPATREDAIAKYRKFRPLVVPAYVMAETEAASAASGAELLSGNSPVRKVRRRAHDSKTDVRTPFFMAAFNSALAFLNHHQQYVPGGQFGWEMIYPQAPGTTNPLYNPWGKYAVKLFYGGAFRRVVVDDRVPIDAAGLSLLTVTEQKEIWPAILCKAILKALGPSAEELLVTNPSVVASFLLPGFAMQRLSIRDQAMLTVTALRTSSAAAGEILSVSRTNCTLPVMGEDDYVTPTAPVAAGRSSPTPPPDNVHHSGDGHPLSGTRSTSPAPVAVSGTTVHAPTVRLPSRQLFVVLGVRPYNTTTLVHLLSPHCIWKGQFSYDRPVWTAAFEAAIGFDPHRDRDPYLTKVLGWNDFWVSYEEFTEQFDSLMVWRNVVQSSKWCSFKQFAPPAPPEPAAAAPTTTATAKGGAGGAAQASSSPADATRLAPTASWSRWLHTKVTDTHQSKTVLVTLTGCPKPTPNNGASAAPATSGAQSLQVTPRPPGVAAAAGDGELRSSRTSVGGGSNSPAATLAVQQYRWNSSVQFTHVVGLDLHPGVPHVALFTVPPGQHAFKLCASHVPHGFAVSVMSDAELQLTLGEEKDICQGLLQAATVTDAGIFAPHPAGQSTLWFKRFIQVKQPTRANFTMGTLPRGTDLSQHRTVGGPVSGDAAAKGAGKAAAPPAKGGKGGAAGGDGAAGVAGGAAGDTFDEVDHIVPITAYAKLMLINLDTNAVQRDTVLKLLNVVLTPNSKGYLLMGLASIPRDCAETYGRGLWRLHAATDRPMETFEARGFEDITSRQSEYVHNDYNTLFKYNLTVGEAASGTIQLNLQESWGIPFHTTLLHNDKEIDARRDAKGSCMFEHVNFLPSDKTAPNTYSILCMLDSKFTTEWEERRRVQVVQLFQANCQKQEMQLRQRQAEYAAKLAAAEASMTAGEGLGSVSGADPITTAGGDANTDTQQQQQQAQQQQMFSIPFHLILHLSTSKVEVKEDNTIQEHLMQVKASWSKKDAEANAAANAPAKAAKAPAKGQVVVDEAAIRQQKSKESRERFLANLKGIFLPYARDGKTFIEFTDEPGLRRAPILPKGALRTEMPTPSPEPSPCIAATSTPLPTDGKAGGGGGSAAPPLASSSPLPPTAVSTALAPHVVQQFKNIQSDMFDRVNHISAAMKSQKKDVQRGNNEAVIEYWASHRPDKSTVVEDDDKNKKAAGAKGVKK